MFSRSSSIGKPESSRASEELAHRFSPLNVPRSDHLSLHNNRGSGVDVGDSEAKTDIVGDLLSPFDLEKRRGVNLSVATRGG